MGALRVGYRHIDCASVYKNQEEVGDAITQAVASGIVSREQVYPTEIPSAVAVLAVRIWFELWPWHSVASNYSIVIPTPQALEAHRELNRTDSTIGSMIGSHRNCTVQPA